MMHKAVLLDTSFFIRFLNEGDPLFKNADGYFRYFLQNEITIMISTISIAEYCVVGAVNELPLKNLKIIPFNFDHSKRTGELSRIAFNAKRSVQEDFATRNIIPNDTKLFAQADCEKAVDFYLSSDKESLKVYNVLKQETALKFQFLDLKKPYNEAFGLLDL